MVQQNTIQLWLMRLLVYVLLSVIGFILIFPFIYMVSTSLKTAQDVSSNPLRLIPHSPTTIEVDGEEQPLYLMQINGEEVRMIATNAKVNMGEFTTLAQIIPEAPDDSPVVAEAVALDPEDICPLPVVGLACRTVYYHYWRVQAVETNAPVALPLVNYETDFAAPHLQAFPTGETVTVINPTDDDEEILPVHEVLVDGQIQELLLVDNTRPTVFVNPDQPQVRAYGFTRSAPVAEEVEPQFENYKTAYSERNLNRSLINTVLVTVSVTLGQLATSIMGGYAFARVKFPGRDAIFLMYLGSIMIPFVVLIVPLYRLMQLFGWQNHLVALIVPWIFTAYGTFMMRQFFLGIPEEIEEAALLDGASRFRILWTIFVPLSLPAIATQTIFTSLYAWNSFLWPYIIMELSNIEDRVLTLSLIDFKYLYEHEPNIVITGAAITIIPPIIVFILAQRYFIASVSSSAVKG